MWGKPRAKTRKQFYSRLAAQAYASAGIQLVDDPDYCSPAEMRNSTLLREVEAATVLVSVEEAVAWKRHPEKVQLMRDAINAMLDGARCRNKDIQNFDDLHTHLVHYPEDDAYICAILKQSGYLNVWQIEQAANPWQYDLALMEAASRSGGIDDYYPFSRRMLDTTDWARLIMPPTSFNLTPYAYAVRSGDERWHARVERFVAEIKRDGRLVVAARRHRLEPVVARD